MKILAKCLAVVLSGLISLSIQGQGQLRGTVIDKLSGEKLAGVNITNNQALTGTSSRDDGSFTFKLENGQHTITFSIVGYASLQLEIDITNGETKDLGKVYLVPEIIGLGEVTVISSVAVDRRSPLTVSSISATTIETRLGDEPLPEVMKMVPGVYGTRTGGGSGDAAVNIRGFQQENLTLMLNGVPVSSVENGLVYWNNWLGLADATARIQVQRGLGASPAAMNSVGGTINIITHTAASKMGGNIGYSFTSYGNQKLNLSYSTGTLDNGLSVTFMGSRLWGPGYIDATYVSGLGYFLSISKIINEKNTLVFVGLGSPERHGQRNILLNQEETDRNGLKYSKDWGSYNGMINNSSENFYHKPHLSLNHYWKINKRSMLSTAAYFSYGHGGGKWSDNFMTSLSIWDYRNPSGQIDWNAIYDKNSMNTDSFMLATGETVTGFSKNIQTDYLASHVWTGLISTFDHELNENITLTAGIHYRFFRSKLQQKVRDLLGGDFYIDDYAWSLSGVSGRDQVKYTGDVIKVDNGALIHYINVFTKLDYNGGWWNAFLAGSISENWFKRYDYYNYTEDPWSETVELAGYDIKGGINLLAGEAHNFYINAGYFSRVPYYKFIFGNFTNQVSTDLANEKISSLEAGYGFTYNNSRLRLNAYYTYWADKSFLANEYDQFLAPVLIRGLDADHRGIELELEQRLYRNFSMAGIVSLGKWIWKNNVYAEVYDNNNVLQDTIRVYADGLYVGDAPQTQLGLSASYHFLDHFTLALNWVYYDRLYSDFNPVNRNNADDMEQSYLIPSYQLIDAYFTVNFDLFGQAAGVNINLLNLLNNKYIMRGLDGPSHTIQDFTGFWGFGRTLNVGFNLTF